MLILDIFAQRAQTFEGKLQVELAQLKHLSTRLIRGWTHLERQKGSPLTEQEVLDIRDKGVCMMLRVEHAIALDEKQARELTRRFLKVHGTDWDVECEVRQLDDELGARFGTDEKGVGQGGRRARQRHGHGVPRFI